MAVRRPHSARRKALLAAAGLALLAAALAVVFVLRVSNASSGKVRIGRTTFEVGRARDLARAIDRDHTPLLFQDLLQRSRDIWVQHQGGDATTGWRAFEAHAPGQPRRCQVVWQRLGGNFRDPCTGHVYPADGAGLTQYPTSVNQDGRVVVDLRRALQP